MRQAAVRCPTCPDHPVLAAPPDTDTRRCIRCQGEHRRLPQPHPVDHLCDVCRSECPRCDAPAGPGLGGLCRDCAGLCRDCGGPVPRRPHEQGVTSAPAVGADRPRLLFASTWTRGLCDGCREGRTDRERQVLRGFPAKLTRACGGHAPARAVYVVRAELAHVSVTRLRERVERRWWQQWADRPLARPADEDAEGYGPDDVAVWLVVPTPCRGGCEDGWVADDPDQPCPVCRPRTPHRAVAERSAVAEDMAATARAAVRAGQAAGPRGDYVPEGARDGDRQYAERVRRLAEEKRARPATRRRHDITVAEEQEDPTWAAAVRRAREERGEPR